MTLQYESEYYKICYHLLASFLMFLFLFSNLSLDRFFHRTNNTLRSNPVGFNCIINYFKNMESYIHINNITFLYLIFVYKPHHFLSINGIDLPLKIFNYLHFPTYTSPTGLINWYVQSIKSLDKIEIVYL